MTRKKSSQVKTTKFVCARCGQDWQGPGCPGRCPACGEVSYAIAVARKEQNK